MALDRTLRDLKEDLLLPGSRIVGRFVTPIQITLVGLIFGVLAPLSACYGYFLLASLFWWINRLLDGIDGTVARVTKQQTDFGGYLDIVCDFIVYTLLPISLVIESPSQTSYLIVALLEASFCINATSQMYLGSILELSLIHI